MKGGEKNMDSEQSTAPTGNATLTSQINFLDQLINTTSKRVFGDRPVKAEDKGVYKGRIGSLIERLNDMIKTVGEINKELEKLGK